MHSSGFVPRLSPTKAVRVVEPAAGTSPATGAELLAVWRFGLAAAVFAAGVVLRLFFVLC
jgi:hypothetical protein